ncbi:MAG: aminotransferase class V-fold PLP-dependent enzyme [Bryobacteraceae bacterium]
MIYLDNAATTHPKPPSVYERVDDVLRNWSANPGRSGHAMAIEAARIIFQTRESIAKLFNIADPDRIIFTGNATGALNLAILGLLEPGDHCVTSTMEHNSVVRPLHALEQKCVRVTRTGADPRSIAAAIEPQTRLVALTHASNVSGDLNPVAEIIAASHAQGVPVLVDAAQTAGCVPIDVQALGVDLLACPGHKGLFGPQGTGFLYIAPHLNPEPILFGGTGSRSDLEDMPDFAPDRYEAGTLNTPGIAGLGAGVDFLLDRGVEQVRAHELARLRQLMDGLATIDGLTIHGARDPARKTGVVLFTLDGIDPAEIGDRLDQEFGIAVRVGLHCAPQAHRTLGTFPIGGVRMSPGYFNTAEEIAQTVEAVSRIAIDRTVAV